MRREEGEGREEGRGERKEERGERKSMKQKGKQERKKMFRDCFFDIAQFCLIFTLHTASNRKLRMDLGTRLIYLMSSHPVSSRFFFLVSSEQVA